jgi:hypothetical protein
MGASLAIYRVSGLFCTARAIRAAAAVTAVVRRLGLRGGGRGIARRREGDKGEKRDDESGLLHNIIWILINDF